MTIGIKTGGGKKNFGMGGGGEFQYKHKIYIKTLLKVKIRDEKFKNSEKLRVEIFSRKNSVRA